MIILFYDNCTMAAHLSSLVLSLIGLLWIGEAQSKLVDKNALVYVQLLFRHGDRAPEHFYKNDPFVDSWPQGAGHLSTLGVEQQYALGQFLRSRYAGFLGLDTDGVSLADVYVRSTDVERAITSAQTNVASFLRPAPSSSTSKAAKAREWTTLDTDLAVIWQPVPVHTVPQKHDWVMHEADCKRLETLRKKFEESDKIQAIKARPAVQDLLKTLSNITSVPFEQWTITSSFKSVADTLFCEHQHKLILPNVPETFYADVQALRELIWPMPFAESNFAQLRGGCILDTFARNMRDKLENTSGTYSGRKLVVFSGHDTSLLGLIAAAGLLDKVAAQPQYAAMVLFELYADGTVEILYKNDPSSLEAIRTSPPVSLLTAPLSDLEASWKTMRLNETEYENLCNRADVNERLTPLPCDEPTGENVEPDEDHQV